MSIARGGVVLNFCAVVMAFAGSASLFSQQQGAPVAPRPLVGIDLQKTMPFVFENAPVSAILGAMSESFGFVTINSNLPTTRVTIRMRKEVGPEEAIRVLNEILTPMGYVAVITNTAADSATGKGGSTIVRVVPIVTGSRQVPVYTSADPEDIPLSDEIKYRNRIQAMDPASPAIMNAHRSNCGRVALRFRN